MLATSKNNKTNRKNSTPPKNLFQKKTFYSFFSLVEFRDESMKQICVCVCVFLWCPSHSTVSNCAWSSCAWATRNAAGHQNSTQVSFWVCQLMCVTYHLCVCVGVCERVCATKQICAGYIISSVPSALWVGCTLYATRSLYYALCTVSLHIFIYYCVF